MVRIAECKAPGQNCVILDPICIPVEDIAINVNRALHHLLDDLHIAAELLPLDKVNFQPPPRFVVDTGGIAYVLTIKYGPYCIRSAKSQDGLCLHRDSQTHSSYQ